LLLTRNPPHAGATLHQPIRLKTQRWKGLAKHQRGAAKLQRSIRFQQPQVKFLDVFSMSWDIMSRPYIETSLIELGHYAYELRQDL
jgi:hypothetical protein